MSACSDSDRRMIARIGRLSAVAMLGSILTLAALMALTPYADADTNVTTETRAHGGDQIRIGPDGVVIRHGNGTVDSIADGDRVEIHSKIMNKGVNIEIDDGETGLVRMFSDITVPADEHISGDVVTLFGSVHVLGQVTGQVVAVMGSVRLDPGAVVDGDVVAVGGSLDQADGAVVNGESVSVGLLPAGWGMPTLPVLLGLVGVGWLTSLFFGWMFALLFPTRFVRVAATASRRTTASFFLGLLSVPGSILLIGLLFVTVIGIPIAILAPLAFALLGYAGQMAATYVLGCKLTRRPLGGGRDLIVPLAAGLLFIAVFFVIGAALPVLPGNLRIGALLFFMIGSLLMGALTAIGTGAFLLSRFGRDPADVMWGLDAPPSASATGA